ncbi:MAG: hypothetical protein ACI9PZ_002289, partial [Parvicella sp.]
MALLTVLNGTAVIVYVFIVLYALVVS